MNDEIVNELHKPIRKVKNLRGFEAHYPNEIWSMDLVDMQAFKEDNETYRYMITCIDVYSRYAWVAKLKDKTGKETLKGIQEIIQKAKTKPHKIWVDQGSEFYNRDVQTYLRSQNIELYSSHGEHKAFLIERFNRTLKSKMFRVFTKQLNHKWISIVEDLVKKYNSTVHSTLKKKPQDVIKAKPQPERFVYEKKLEEEPAFQVGDKVRISYKLGPFDKSYLPTWTYEIFTISDVIRSVPITYKIKDHTGEELEGGFYKDELQKTSQSESTFLVEKVIKTKTVRGHKKYFVKWLGYDKRHNSWIDEDQFAEYEEI